MRLSDIFLKCSFAFVVLALVACEQTDSDVTQPREEIARPAKIVPVVSGGVSVLRTFASGYHGRNYNHTRYVAVTG